MEILNLLKYALKVDIGGQLYYDFSERSLERLRNLTIDNSHLYAAIENNLVVRQLFGTSYLVPAEIVNRSADWRVKI